MLLDLFQRKEVKRLPGAYTIVIAGKAVMKFTWSKTTRLRTNAIEQWRKQKEYARRYVQRHPDRVAASHKKYRETHSAILSAKGKQARRNATPEQRAKLAAQARERRARKNQDPAYRAARAAYFAARYQANRERYLEYARAYRLLAKGGPAFGSNAGADKGGALHGDGPAEVRSHPEIDGGNATGNPGLQRAVSKVL